VVGTLWLVFGAVLFAVPLGVGTAVFLTEYAERERVTQIVEVATNGLWSTPSIVFGLFGLAFLVPRISGGNSIFVGQLVLGFMLLPLVLITSREAILAVPDDHRGASAALGVTKWETIRSVVVPAAMPGTITGVILGVGRIAGETAPLLLLVFGGAPYPNSTPDVIGAFEFSAQPRSSRTTSCCRPPARSPTSSTRPSRRASSRRTSSPTPSSAGDRARPPARRRRPLRRRRRQPPLLPAEITPMSNTQTNHGPTQHAQPSTTSGETAEDVRESGRSTASRATPNSPSRT